MYAWLVLPDQLFQETVSRAKSLEITKIVLLEHPLYFDRYRYHRAKLLFHKASILAFIDYCRSKGMTVCHVPYKRGAGWKKHLRGYDEIYAFPIPNHFLSGEIQRASGDRLVVQQDTPMFLKQPSELEEIWKRDKKLTHFAFYKQQRREFEVLVRNGKPRGGQWRHDDKNRKAFKGSPYKIPKLPKLGKKDLTYYRKAKAWLSKQSTLGKRAYGEEIQCWPVTFSSAKRFLTSFIDKRLRCFGPYQDAIVPDQSFLFHSGISPLLNSGLLTPRQVIDKTCASSVRVPIQSLEGFLAQILGWREFMLGVYLADAPKYDERGRCKVPNKFRFKRKLPASFWTGGGTGIELVDHTIRKLLGHAYLHHIERLMVVGSVMLMSEYRPADVYEWFSSLFVDAYDWVMYGNVMMSQYNDHGEWVARKPYISSYNYIQRMTTQWETVPEDKELWDALFWAFLGKHRALMKKTAYARNLGGLKSKDMKEIKAVVARYHRK